ncbi:MAG: DUF1080 domain-containing protein [Phycisphaerales bacterium]
MSFALAACAMGGCALPDDDGADAATPSQPTGPTTARVISAPAGYTPLFNGRDLTGWSASGDIAAFKVENGEILVTDAAYGGWLRTNKTYRDFDLLLEFNVPEGGNSGVGLRGSSGGDPAFTGFEVQIYDNFGEEPTLRSCGSVYEAIAADSMAVNKPGEWNTYRIRLVGDRLSVWLNEVQIHDNERLDDRGFFRSEDSPLPLNTRATTGYISLQDHGDAVRFRNIAIRDLSIDPEPDGMVPLINGMDAGEPAGWFAEDDATWTVDDAGTLIGRGGPGHLFTDDDTFTDFELRGLVKVNERGNSGIYIRVHPNPDMVWPVGHGYEAQIDNHDPNNLTGAIYDMCPVQTNPGTRDNAWFDYRIRFEGDRVRTWINSVPMADCERSDFAEGGFAVQGHHPGNVIMFRDLRVKRLD